MAPAKNVQLHAAVLEKYAAGKSFGMIATELAVTRNVVAGIVHRSGEANRGGVKLPFRDLTGERFGSWTVVKQGRTDLYGNKHWLCRCDCGTLSSDMQASTLKTGSSKSCGCRKGENRKAYFARRREEFAA